MNLRQRKSKIALMLSMTAMLAMPVASHAAGLLGGLLGSKTTTSTTAAGGTTNPGLISQLTGGLGLIGTGGTGSLGSLSGLLGGTGTATGGIGLDALLGGTLGPVLNNLNPGTLINLVSNQAQLILFTLDVGGITKSYISMGGNLINVTNPILNPLLQSLTATGRSVTRLLIPTTSELGRLVGGPTGQIINNVTPALARQIIGSINSATGGEIRALIPMPLDPTRTCESCHTNKASLLLAMTDVVYNIKYPGLALDALFIDNFYVESTYTTRTDSMMSKAALHPLWKGCTTCHGTGATFNPFPSDNWVPKSNPNDDAAHNTSKAYGSTNDASKACGQCHAANAAAFNKGIMGTHRGHLWAFNYNDVEIEGTNSESNFFYDPFGSKQAGTDLTRLGTDRNGKGMHAGYYQSRKSCSTCHQSCSDCHMTGPGDQPMGLLAVADVPKLDPTVAGVDMCNVDRTHIMPMVRVKAMEGSSLRRGGVALMEMRKGYIAGISRGIPYSVYETGMDVARHKIGRPTTAEEGNILDPKTQQQSIGFCWRCHFRTGAEYNGNWINVVPNVNYEKASLGHLQAGMSCTDCHKSSEVHGYTSPDSQSFNGTTDAADNPSHPGGNPIGSTPKWDITPNPIKVTCGLCHTTAGKALGPKGGLTVATGQLNPNPLYQNLVTPKFQTIAKNVKSFNTMVAPGTITAHNMSHKNVKCEACHTQAMQNCWNCHLENSKTLTGLPLIGTNDFALDILLPIVNVREAEGIPSLTFEENALLKEAYNENEVANLNLALVWTGSPNTVNKSVRFLARNNQGQVGSVVHCPGTPTGINNPNSDPQPLNKDGGQYQTKSGAYGEVGSVGDVTYAAQGAWYMEAGHSIARAPDGVGYEGCYNCHADTVRMGQDPITYYRKNPWVMKSIGTPEALMPGSHYAAGYYKNPNGGFNCSCHSSDGLVHNGNFSDVAAKWQLDLLPQPITPTNPGPVGPDGAALYGTHCAGCHMPLASSNKKGLGVTTAMVKAVIAGTSTTSPMGNMMMSSLRGALTDAEIDAIVAVLQ